MATIGKRRAVARTGRLVWTGLIAWLAWLFVHLVYLISFKNRVSVLLQWVWSYVFSRRGARLITEHDWKLEP
jgi:NADH dehydrogenase